MTVQNRYEFVALIEVVNGNPNGDPDAGNSPRVDAETGYGLISDVCLKRKIRNYVNIEKEGEEGYNILIKESKALNTRFKEAYTELGLKTNKKDKDNAEDQKLARAYMCKNYFDVRAFGAVMSTGDYPCGIVRGPVQISFAQSVSPVNAQEITITRQAKTTEERRETGETEMGNKHIIPYGLYRAEGFISAALANKVSGLTEDDVELIWEAIINMFEHDRSAARGKMCVRKLYVFKHNSVRGNSPAHLLFEKININEKCGDLPPRSFSDYEITVDRNMPDGVELIEKL